MKEKSKVFVDGEDRTEATVFDEDGRICVTVGPPGESTEGHFLPFAQWLDITAWIQKRIVEDDQMPSP